MSVNRLVIYIPTGTGNEVSTIDSEEDYGVVTLEINDASELEVSNVTSQEWYGVNGEDVYIPASTKFKAYDVTFKLGVKEKEEQDKDAREVMEDFIEAISGKTFEMMNEYVAKTWKGCYVKKVSDDEIGEGWLTFSMVVRVTEPE